MSSNTKLILKIAGVLVILGLVIFFVLRYTTKAHSPAETITFEKDDLKIEVFYNRPYKKKRVIFGNLVPYNEVWRTGANEATTFETNQNILVDGSLLKAGKYTLWTIPMENSWKVIFNSQMYPWGINLDKEAYRDPVYDALVLERPAEKMDKVLEQFTIRLKESGEFINMSLAWDDIKVSVPIKKEEVPSDTSSSE